MSAISAGRAASVNEYRCDIAATAPSASCNPATVAPERTGFDGVSTAAWQSVHLYVVW